MSSQKRNDYTEVSRKSRVKMHKSGKHWVRTVMSQIGFIHLGKHGASESSKIKLTSVNRQESATKLLRGLVAAGAVVGGGLTAEQVLAEDTVIASEITTLVLANEDIVDMSDVGTESAVSSQSVSESESTSGSESISNSESTSDSESDSVSTSTSESISESESISFSESTSSSESSVLSELTIASENSQSSSTTSELSESSISESTTSEETPQQVLEQVVSEGEILIKIAESQLSTASDSDLAAALAALQSDIVMAKQLLGNSAVTQAEIETIVSSLQTNSLALGTELLKDKSDNILTVSLSTTINSTQTGFTISDFTDGGTQYYWSGGDSSKLLNTITSISAIYDSVKGTISWTVVYDPTAVLTSTYWKNNGAYTGIYIDTTQDSNLGSPTNVLIDGSSTTSKSNPYVGSTSQGTEYISTSKSIGITTHTITFTTAYSGSTSDLSTLKIKLVAASSVATSVYEDASNLKYGRYNSNTAPYVVANDAGTAIGGYFVNGINQDSIPSDSTSQSVSQSESVSKSESVSESESLSNSISNSISESITESVSESVSSSESLSDSISNSISES
ncbi:TPA: KxYKxGKxW signal peptide domain-containing protein, partial [Streptococcus suis]|nr:KxYKxGKxW signal peptide domain-containing protein [Streptococcus suis]